MKKKSQRIVHLLVVILVTPFITVSQDIATSRTGDITFEDIVDSLDHQFHKVQDYTVKVKISVDMPRFRMPKKTVKLYFKQPNKVKVEADGFAVVPKTGLTISPVQMFKDLFDLEVVGQELLDGHAHWVVEGTLHPDSVRFQVWSGRMGPENQVRMRLWVNSKGWVITQTETYLDTVKVMSIKSNFDEFDDSIWLPKVTELRFFLAGEFLARMDNHEPFGGSLGENEDIDNGRGVSDSPSVVRLEFSRYKVNHGLKDKIFKDTTF